MNGLSDIATIGRIAAIEEQVAALRAEAYRRAGIPLPPTMERLSRITELAATIFRVSQTALIGQSHVRKFCRARFAVMWVATEAHGLSSTEIGRALGHRDHSTVLHGVNRAEELRESDSEYRELTDRLLAIVTPKRPHQEEAENAPSSH